ncbi:Alanine racemase, N-terminal domain [Algoriphagus boritolerans DSM 17298 = JCM 18970]|uniref:Alanine racemase, N-terminal domain n=1 Tax=Algoriphagus boritolerans DSM 17298 = JCM 18970 TaxID=1120964 RepID=A0A1H5YEA9_9BACT|nr:Alanine racemase, N-terminal domain [Algoriphagus boritolerans DSM 17298 = JCM 18970]
MHHTSSLEISASAYSQNIKFIRSRIGPAPVISAVVKGNAYGHGIAQLVPIAEQVGVHHFSTFSSDEAREVLASSTLPNEIMIMGMLQLEEIPDLIQLGIQFLFSILNDWKRRSKPQNRKRRKPKFMWKSKLAFEGRALNGRIGKNF